MEAKNTWCSLTFSGSSEVEYEHRKSARALALDLESEADVKESSASKDIPVAAQGRVSSPRPAVAAILMRVCSVQVCNSGEQAASSEPVMEEVLCSGGPFGVATGVSFLAF